MILIRPNRCGWVQILLDGSHLFWTSPNPFGHVQSHDLNLIIWTRPKQIAPFQNELHQSKKIWTVQNHFGLIEGQGINVQLSYL